MHDLINMSTILYVALMKLHVCYIRIVLMCVQVMHACDKHEHYHIYVALMKLHVCYI